MSQDAGTFIQPRPVFYQEFVPQVAPIGSFWIRVSDSSLFYYSGDIARGIVGWVRIFENSLPLVGFSGDLVRHRVTWEDPDLVDYASTETYETGLLKTVGAEIRSVIVTSIDCNAATTTTTTPTTTTTSSTTTTTTTTPTTTTTTTPTTTTTTTTPELPVSGASIWLRANALSLSDNDPVTTWLDSSGFGNNAAQATAGKKPLFKTAIVNGLPVVRFDGTDDTLSLGNILDNPGALTVFVVLKSSNSGGVLAKVSAAVNWQGWASPYGAGRYIVHQTDNGNYRFWDTAVAYADSAFRYFSTTWDGSTITHRVNGAVVGAQANGGAFSSSANGADLHLGSFSDFGDYLNGDVAELVIYPSVLSTGDRQAVEAYLAAKYGL